MHMCAQSAKYTNDPCVRNKSIVMLVHVPMHAERTEVSLFALSAV